MIFSVLKAKKSTRTRHGRGKRCHRLAGWMELKKRAQKCRKEMLRTSVENQYNGRKDMY